jgi:hypothetical protein
MLGLIERGKIDRCWKGEDHEYRRLCFEIAHRTPRGPLRIAYLPCESTPVIYSVHGAIAEHYKIDPAKLKESHASTIDYVVSATAG